MAVAVPVRIRRQRLNRSLASVDFSAFPPTRFLSPKIFAARRTFTSLPRAQLVIPRGFLTRPAEGRRATDASGVLANAFGPMLREAAEPALAGAVRA
jgi:hypothetical protein